MLGDRITTGDKVVPVEFLGRPALLPMGPMVLASMLGAPVILFFGVHLGARRYEVRFEPFADRLAVERSTRTADLTAWAQRFAARLEGVCRAHPYNWFNFYDFWGGQDDVARPASTGLLLATALVGAGLGPSPALAAGLDKLMSALSKVREVRSNFREEKELAGLTAPLLSSGTLAYSAPNHLEKRTSQPFRSDHRRGRLADLCQAGRRHPLHHDPDKAPELRGLVEAVRGTLAGDLMGLRRYYSVASRARPMLGG